eukprot:12416663-Alexandrium_andersonii.AAC.1
MWHSPRGGAGRHVREAEPEPLWDARDSGALGGPLYNDFGGVRLCARPCQCLLLAPLRAGHPA